MKNIKFKKGLFKEALILGYKRSLRNQQMQFIRIKIPYVNDEKKAKSFLGKNVIYLKKINNDKKIKWGKIVSLHGRSGTFLVKFKKNINPNNLEYKLIVAPFPF